MHYLLDEHFCRDIKNQAVKYITKAHKIRKSKVVIGEKMAVMISELV